MVGAPAISDGRSRTIAARWYPHYWPPRRAVRFCQDFPRFAKDHLIWQIVNSGKQYVVDGARLEFNCYHGCIMSLKDAQEAQRNACLEQCRIQSECLPSLQRAR